jgi:hypothetical protein
MEAVGLSLCWGPSPTSFAARCSLEQDLHELIVCGNATATTVIFVAFDDDALATSLNRRKMRHHRSIGGRGMRFAAPRTTAMAPLAHSFLTGLLVKLSFELRMSRMEERADLLSLPARPLFRFWLWLAALAGLNGLDWLLTRFLVQQGEAYEANPFAAQVLQRFGWWGLGFLKLCSTALVLLTVCVLCWNKQARLARRLLQCGLAIMLGVVAYSVLLLCLGHDRESLGIMARAHEFSQALDSKRQRQVLYLEKVEELARRLHWGRLTLGQATRELSAYCERIRPEPYFDPRDVDASPSLQGCLAARLIRQVSQLVGEGPNLQLLDKLRVEFSSQFHVAFPSLAPPSDAIGKHWPGRALLQQKRAT